MTLRRAWTVLAFALLAVDARAQVVLVSEGSACTYIANTADPGIGMTWTADSFDDSAWTPGVYGIGYESGTGAAGLISTTVPGTTFSCFTRTTFNVPNVAAVQNLLLGCDYDDGWAAWINGVEVHRSAEMPGGALDWNTNPELHESSNGASPSYTPYRAVSAAGIPALRDGMNVLAVGIWNGSLPSSDLVLVPELVMNAPLAIDRGPYLQIGTPTGVVVRWRTTEPVVGRVQVGDAPGSLSRVFDEARATTEHEVFVTGLSPATRYTYSVGTPAQVLAGDDSAHWFTTPPPTGTRQRFRAWILGDSGTANADARRVRDGFEAWSGSASPDLWLMLGDNAYDSGTDSQYQAAVFDTYPETLRTSVLWPTIGNHDALSADSTTQSGVYYDVFTLPAGAEAGGLPSGTEAYWSFDWANVHFVCLDSEDLDRSATGAMAIWLEQDLAATSQDWIIAYWHHPCYTKGTHDSDSETRHIEMRQGILPILEQGGVDLVLGGHSHAYERSFLVDGHYDLSSTFGPANLIDGGNGRVTGDGAYVKPSPGPAPHEGEVHVVAGSSGKTGTGTFDHPAMHVSQSVLGSLVLDVDRNRADITFIDDAGAVVDEFTITKGFIPANETSCTNGVDDDFDNRIDCADPDCAVIDEDGDGLIDCIDCAPLDGGSFNTPREIARIDVAKPAGSATDSEIAWSDPRPRTGTGTVADVATGGLRALWADRGFAAAGCLARDVASLSVQDARLTGISGDGFWYLARARNACGATSWGRDSAGVDRLLPLGACN
jgi:hypothetical protein